MLGQRCRARGGSFLLLFPGLVAMLAGCASPSAPKPPSLHLPEAVQDFSAVRSGKDVVLRFALPTRTTDGLPLAGASLSGSVCRQDAPDLPCRTVHVAGEQQVLTVKAGPSAPQRVWTDVLPPGLTTGLARPILYRITLRNAAGREGLRSTAAAAGAGVAPPPVENLSTTGTRAGLLLQWTAVPGAGEILLRREQIRPLPVPASGHPEKDGKQKSEAAQEPGITWLQAEPGNPAAARTLDNTAQEGVLYRYTAVRQQTATAGGKAVILRSAPGAPVEATWRDVYPPPAPTGLTAVGFAIPLADGATGGGFAVDLVWQPVQDARLAGYLVERAEAAQDGAATGPMLRLTKVPLPAPGFHDTTAEAGRTYRYEVTAVDGRGNRSAPAVAVLRASALP